MLHIAGKRQRVFCISSISICNVRLRYIKLEAKTEKSSKKNISFWLFLVECSTFIIFAVSPALCMYSNSVILGVFRCMLKVFQVFFNPEPGSSTFLRKILFCLFFGVRNGELFATACSHVAMYSELLPMYSVFSIASTSPAHCSGTRQFMSLDGQFNSYEPAKFLQ